MGAPIAAMLAPKPSSAKTLAVKKVRLTRSTRVENPEAAIFSLLAIVVPSSRETTIPGDFADRFPGLCRSDSDTRQQERSLSDHATAVARTGGVGDRAAGRQTTESSPAACSASQARNHCHDSDVISLIPVRGFAKGCNVKFSRIDA